jgi:hypothetical protein
MDFLFRLSFLPSMLTPSSDSIVVGEFWTGE